MTAYLVTHTTQYRYGHPVTVCHNEAYLVPREMPRQQCRITQLQIDPAPAVRDAREDFFGNRVVYFAIQKSHTTLRVSAVSEVAVTAAEPLDPERSRPWEQVRDDAFRRADLMPFLLDSPYVPVEPDWLDYATRSFPAGRPFLSGVQDLMGRIFADFKYDPGFTTLATPIAEVFAHRRGVCQDFAHLAIACLRALRLPARYVSGYLLTLPPPGQVRLTGADASHAWFGVHCPDLGWVDFDPTNNRLPSDQHITVAWGRDYSDVPPLKGVILGGGPHTLEVSVDVRPVG